MPILLNVSVLGLLAGLTFCVEFALVPIWNALDASSYLREMQGEIPAFTRAVKPLLIVGFITFLIRLTRHRSRWSASHGWVLASFLMFAAGALITLGGSLPINHQLMSWPTQNPPVNWEVLRLKWDHLNFWRFATAQLGFITGLVPLLFAPQTETAGQQADRGQNRGWQY